MEIKKIIVPSMNKGISVIKEYFGDDGVIIASRKVGDSWEIIAAANEIAAQKYSDRKTKRDQFTSKVLINEVIPSASTKVSTYDEVAASIHDDNTVISHEDEEVTVEDLDDEIKAEEEQERHNQTLEEFKHEISDIKNYLKSHYANIVWKDFKHDNELNSILLKSMYQKGFSIEFSKKIIQEACPVGDIQSGLKSVIDYLKNTLQVIEQPFHNPGIYCFVGAPGSGKTTMMLKVAMILKQKGNGNIHVLNCDFDNLTQNEQLDRLGELLGFTVHHLESNFSKLNQLYVQGNDYVLMDMPNQKELLEVVSNLSHEENFNLPIQYNLILDANWHGQFVSEQINQLQHLDNVSLTFSKCDLSSSMCEIIESSINSNLPIGLLSYDSIDPDKIKKANSNIIMQIFNQQSGQKESLSDLEVFTMLNEKN